MSEHAIENARAWLEDIGELVAKLGSDDADGAEFDITQSALSVQVRDGWYAPGADASEREPEEYEILLTTGGPALRIAGKLACCEPDTAELQWQDWGTPWTRLELTDDEQAAVDAFARCFYFGEG